MTSGTYLYPAIQHVLGHPVVNFTALPFDFGTIRHAGANHEYECVSDTTECSCHREENLVLQYYSRGL